MKSGRILIGLALVSACTDAQVPAPEVTTSDSAGVRILSIARPLSGAASLGVTPVWTHGFEPGHFPFQRVISGALLSDGSAVVADVGSSEVVAVSAETGFRVLMGAGQGPGEVRRPIAVEAHDAGSVWVDDDGNARLVLLAADSVVRSVSTQGRYDLSIALRLRGVDAGGQLLMSTSSFPRDFEGRWRMADLVRLDPDDLTADTLAQYRLAERESGAGRNPFLPYGTSTVVQDGWAVGWAATPEVQRLGKDGRIETIVRWESRDQFPDSEYLDRYRAYLRADLRRVNPGLPEPELESLIERRFAGLEMDPARPLPLFREFIGDDEGRVWVESYEVGTVPTNQYTIVRPDDGAVRAVTFPSPVAILDFREGLILAVVTNELDVSAITVFRVDPFPVGNGVSR